MKKVFACITAAIFLFTGSAFAAPDPTTVVPPKPKLISLEFQDVPLSTVLEILSLKTGRKFVTDIELARKRIMMNLKDVTAEEALDALLATYNLYYVRQADTNIYVIKNKNDMSVTTVSKVIFCNYASARSLEAVLKTKLSRAGTIGSDERTNCLVVTDMADNVDKIEEMVNSIDVPTMQVMLEAKIVDVKIDSDVKLGLEISNMYRTDKYWTNPLELQRLSIMQGLGMDYTIDADKINNFIRPETGYSQGFGHGLSGSAKFQFGILSGDYNIDGFFEALKTDSNARLLSTPRLLVLNNEEATIEIADELPYTTKSISNGTTNISTEFKKAGISLAVKPQVNRDGSIILSVKPKQSFRTGESLENVPIIKTSEANTTLMLQNGDTAVIGGLIRETESDTEYKVPLLGDLPLLGMLFRKSDKEKTRTELTIFITAKIVQ